MRAALLAAWVVMAAGCGGGAAGNADNPSRDPVSGSVDVFAAASLTSAFREEATAFQRQHREASVRFNFAGSSALATQIGQGATADVFASADLPNMQKVAAAGVTDGQPRTFAANKLQIVVGAGNPKAIRSLRDLADPALAVVLCAPAVPCGNYAQQAFKKAGVTVTPKSQEQDVNAVVSKVSFGEADAGVVYVTDIRAAGSRVQGIAIPDAENVAATYPVVTLKTGSNRAGGAAFVDFLLGREGQQVLGRYGFVKP